MNNPGIDVKMWEQLRANWTQLNASGKSVKVDFQLINSDAVKDKTLAIDVVQTIDDEIVVETVQRNAGEAYDILGIAGLSMEDLVQTYKKMLHELHREAGKEEVDLIVEMTPHSDVSGETKGYLQKPGADMKTHIPLNYQHYYVLNALRGKMVELVGDRWDRVKALYHAGGIEFHFDYQEI